MNAFTLTFANVGYGEAMIFEIPQTSHPQGGKFVMLFDGGGDDPAEFANSTSGRRPMRAHLEALGVDHIDAVVISHIHEDHVSGLLPVVRALPPKTVYQTFSPDFWKTAMFPLSEEAGETVSLRKFTKSLNDYRAICACTAEHGGAIVRLTAGDRASFPDGLIADALAPSLERAEELEAALAALYRSASGDVPDQGQLRRLDGAMNNYSLMLRFTYGETRLLLPGDTNRAGFGGIDPSMLPADLYKVGHHGQIDGADRAILDAVKPALVVCCASSDRRYNSAHPDLLRMIADGGAKLLYSDCPPNPVGDPVPPHGLLKLTVQPDHTIRYEYR